MFLLFQQEFSSTDTIVVTHNLNKDVEVRVVNSSGVVDNNLILKLEFDQADPYNKLTVTLKSTTSGRVQILDRTSIFVTAFDKNKIDAIEPGAQNNTASNYGTDGIGVYDSKDGYNLRFRNINSVSDKLSVSLDNTNHKIDLTVNDSYMVHQNLIGVGTHTHSQIDSHIDSYDNPHIVTAAQVGNSVAQWNANQLEGYGISAAQPIDGYALVWNSSENKWLPSKSASLFHAISHISTGNDPINDAVSGGASGLMSGSDKFKLNGITSGAEINTASNYGIGGVGVYDSKDAYDLRFRNINAASNKISVSLDAINHEIDLNINDGYLIHQYLSGAGHYQHSQIDSHMDSYSNPHDVTKSQVGLGNVTNYQQIKGIPSSTAGHFVMWGIDGYNVRDDGYKGNSFEVPLTFSRSVSRSTNDVTLTNDSASPGNNQFYGTNRAGTKGWNTKNIANYLTVGAVGSDCDFTPTLGYGAIYSAIQTAIAGGVSTLNPWQIDIFPGIYAEPKMTIPVGLYLNGSTHTRMDTVFILPIDPTDDLFVSTGGHMNGLHLFGVTTPGKYLVNCSIEGSFTSLLSISIHGCAGGVLVANGAQVVATNYSIIIGAPGMDVGTAMLIDGVGPLGGGKSYAAVQGFFCIVPTAVMPYYSSNPIQKAFSVTNGGEGFIATGSFRVSAIDDTASSVFVDSGGFAFLSGVEIANAPVAFRIGSVGSSSKVLTQGCNFQNNTIDVKIESSTGKAFLSQSGDKLTTDLVAGAKVIGNIQNRNAGHQTIVGDAKYQFLNSGYQVDFGDFFSDYISTGVCGGGVVTEVIGLQVHITAGDGWIRRETPYNDSAWVEWDAYDAYLTPNSTNYIVYDSILDSIKRTSVLATYGESILLSTIMTDETGIRFLHQTRNYLTGPFEQLRTYILGTRKLSLNSGLGVIEGTTSVQFDVSSGSYYLGLDLIALDGYADAHFGYFYGTGGSLEIADSYQLDNTRYDSYGTLTAMADGYFRSDTVFLTSDGKISVIYGSEQFNSQLLAESTAQANTPTFIEPSAFPLAKIVVKRLNGIQNILDIRPQPGNSTGSGDSAGVSVHALLSGLDADDHIRYLLGDGSRAMSGALNMGGFAINSVGNVDGVDVSAHMARHLPGGLDALTTGVPVGVLVGVPSSAGSASSFALSDHQHGLNAKAGAGNDGYLSRIDWTTFYNKEPAQSKGTISSGTASAIIITNGASATVGPNTSITINKASASSDGYLGKDDFTTFTNSIHNPVTLNISAVTGGLSLNTQELSFRAATTDVDGYLKSSDWDIFNSKEPTVTKGALTSNTTSAITITDGAGAVIGNGTSITLNKASADSDGYLGKDNWVVFNNKEPAVVKGNLTEATSDVLTFGGVTTNNVIGTGTSIQVKKASAIQDGYLGKNDFTTFTNSIHNPVTLNISAVTGGLSLNAQELSFRAATTAIDGYLKHVDWNTFYNKEPAVVKGNLTETGSFILTFGGVTTNNVIGTGTSIQVKKASTAQDGYLGKHDWDIFNGKAPLLSPAFTTPSLGVATATSINGNIITTGTGTLTLGASKVLTCSNTITFTATDGATLGIGAGGTLGTMAYRAATLLDGYGVKAGSSLIVTVGTIASGTWNGTDIAVAGGGTGLSSIAAYSVVCGGTTTTGNLQVVSGLGISGQALKSNGASALPSWQNLAAGSDGYVQFNDGGSNVGSDYKFTYNKTTDTLSVGKAVTTANADGTTSYVANVLYGTAAAPSATGLTNGTLYFKHSA